MAFGFFMQKYQMIFCCIHLSIQLIMNFSPRLVYDKWTTNMVNKNSFV